MVQASTGRAERPSNHGCALLQHFQSTVRETETSGVPEDGDSDETRTNQVLGTLVTLGCPNHELSGEFLNWLYPSQTLPWGGVLPIVSKTPFRKDYKSPVGDWLEHRKDLANLARANLRQVRPRELTRRNRTRRPPSFKVGDLVLVHHSQLPTWPRNC